MKGSMVVNNQAASNALQTCGEQNASDDKTIFFESGWVLPNLLAVQQAFRAACWAVDDVT
jgi:hypothetical protein